MTNFGANFKKARESKGVSLDKIASETRISTRFLAAIENEEFHLLPGGIFNRGFVRAFAERVGLDPEQAVADYERLSAVRDPSETLDAAASAAPARIERHLYAVAAGALVLLIVIFYVVTRDSSRTETVNPPPAAVSEPVAPPETAAAAPEPESTPTPPAAEALTLEMEAKETTWIKVAADGNTVVAGEILGPGVIRRFTARNSIDLTIGNAAGLALKINDMRVKPLGKSGQVRELNITADNLRDFIG
ncbi:MAG: helix-turn-helix domain-containing protein [Acidobacteria bacterium]|nr:helix-turn-helix domain-containing protein [Acidobacteriota bacterium]